MLGNIVTYRYPDLSSFSCQGATTYTMREIPGSTCRCSNLAFEPVGTCAGLPAVLLAGLLLRWQSWHWRSGKLSVLGMFAWRWAAAKVGGGFKRAMNAANEPTNVAEELPAAVVGPGTSPTDGILQ